MKRFLLHIGLPKAGSTTMQSVLGQCRDITYLGKSASGEFPDPLVAEFTRAIAPFCDIRMANAKPYRDCFLRCLEQDERGLLVLSDEILSSIGFGTLGSANALPQIIENFRRVLPSQFEVVLIIREQRALLQSYYKELVLMGSPDTFEEFIEIMLLQRSRYILPVLNYVRVARQLSSMVGTLHVLVFEKLFFDEAYARTKLSAIGLTEAAGIMPGTHERPSQPEAELLSRLEKRYPTIWTQQDRFDVRAQNAALFVHGDIKSEVSQRITQALRAKLRWLSEPGMREARARKIREQGLLWLPPEVETRLYRMFSIFNSELSTLDPELDWEGMGYLR